MLLFADCGKYYLLVQLIISEILNIHVALKYKKYNIVFDFRNYDDIL